MSDDAERLLRRLGGDGGAPDTFGYIAPEGDWRGIVPIPLREMWPFLSLQTRLAVSIQAMQMVPVAIIKGETAS